MFETSDIEANFVELFRRKFLITEMKPETFRRGFT